MHRVRDDYDVMHSEEELDQDTQSIEENADEEERLVNTWSKHLDPCDIEIFRKRFGKSLINRAYLLGNNKNKNRMVPVHLANPTLGPKIKFFND